MVVSGPEAIGPVKEGCPPKAEVVRSRRVRHFSRLPVGSGKHMASKPAAACPPDRCFGHRLSRRLRYDHVTGTGNSGEGSCNQEVPPGPYRPDAVTPFSA